MRLLWVSKPASQLSLLLFFLIPLTTLCLALEPPPHPNPIATRFKHVRAERKDREPEEKEQDKRPLHPSTQPFSTQLIPPTTNQTRPLPSVTGPYAIRLDALHPILASPEILRQAFQALERFCDAIALVLVNFDLLDAQDLVLRVGALQLELRDVTEQLHMLAVKAVVMRLLGMAARGLLGFVEGEVVDVTAGVRMIFTFGVVGGWDGEG